LVDSGVADWRGDSLDGYGVAPDQGRMDDYLRVSEDGY
jgi:hypothetical protein